jgi:hypothetical protein
MVMAMPMARHRCRGVGEWPGGQEAEDHQPIAMVYPASAALPKVECVLK